jgi:hypothetical protein
MWFVQRGSSRAGVSYVKDFYPKTWFKARKRLGVSGVNPHAASPNA